jgi:hypothetical protein
MTKLRVSLVGGLFCRFFFRINWIHGRCGVLTLSIPKWIDDLILSKAGMESGNEEFSIADRELVVFGCLNEGIVWCCKQILQACLEAPFRLVSPHLGSFLCLSF